MPCTATLPLVHGTETTDSKDTSTLSGIGPTTHAASNPLERLSQLLHSNDRLMDELTASRARIVSARAYLDRPGCNVKFGSAHLERCRSRHSGILAQLRANRIEALHLLGEGSSDSRSDA